MHLITANNVRDALPKAVQYLFEKGESHTTRQGPALVAPEPVTIHYLKPKEHVLINPIRDANPFFHIMEAMWMLAGRDDGAFLDYYIKGFSKSYGDEHGRIMDAYGYRWRFGLDEDQLIHIVEQLKKDPHSRQVVLQMWGAGRDDLFEQQMKPCNLNATFRVRYDKLNMMVQNRSNDLIWGACGANAVHFSILLEYIAGMAGYEMGEYWQVSNNLHFYLNHIQMLYERTGLAGDVDPLLHNHLESPEPYGKTFELIKDPSTFDDELKEAMMLIDNLHGGSEFIPYGMTNPFISDVVLLMALAHYYHKKGRKDLAIDTIDHVSAMDWHMAGRQWLERRNA